MRQRGQEGKRKGLMGRDRRREVSVGVVLNEDMEYVEGRKERKPGSSRRWEETAGG